MRAASSSYICGADCKPAVARAIDLFARILGTTATAQSARLCLLRFLRGERCHGAFRPTQLDVAAALQRAIDQLGRVGHASGRSLHIDVTREGDRVALDDDVPVSYTHLRAHET